MLSMLVAAWAAYWAAGVALFAWTLLTEAFDPLCEHDRQEIYAEMPMGDRPYSTRAWWLMMTISATVAALVWPRSLWLLYQIDREGEKR